MSRKTTVLLASLLLTALIMGFLAAVASAVTTQAKKGVAQPHSDGLMNPERKPGGRNELLRPPLRLRRSRRLRRRRGLPLGSGAPLRALVRQEAGWPVTMDRSATEVPWQASPGIQGLSGTCRRMAYPWLVRFSGGRWPERTGFLGLRWRTA